MKLSINRLADIMAGWKGRVPRWADELRKMGVTDVAFFSQLSGMRVVDMNGKNVGKVADLLITPGEKFMDISGIVYHSKLFGRYIVPWERLDVISDVVRLNMAKEQIPPGEIKQGELSLKETVLDKQIVDTDGLKVVRVNDILLAQIGSHISVIGVDTGMKGIMRRLGLLKPLKRILPPIHEHIIPWAYIEPLQPELRSLYLKIPRHGISELDPADIADIIEELNNRQRLSIIKSLDNEIAAETIEESEPDVQVSIARCLNKEKMARILENMYPEEAADLLGMLPKDKASELLSLMKKSDASEISTLLQYPERSAGGMMTPEFISVSEDATVGDAIDEIRRLKEEVYTVYYVYVTDRDEHPVGVVSLKDLIVAARDSGIKSIMTEDLEKVYVDTPGEDVASIMAKYDLLSVPVTDHDDRLKGVVSIDDVIDMVIPPQWKHHLPKTFPRRGEPEAAT